jgi:hypothetical protein
MENQEQPTQLDIHDDDDYYAYTKTRVIDMIVGLIIGVGYVILATILAVSLKMETSWWLLTFLVVIYLGIVWYYFRKKRKYIAIGLIFTVTGLPAIIGGCIYLTS